METRGRTRTADRDREDAEDREVRDDVEPVRADYAPEGTDARTGLWPTLKRTALEFQEDNMTDWAAALTYYGLLSLFPALIALVSVLGLFGDPQTTTQQITDIVTQIGPSSAADTFAGPIESITSNRSAAGILFFVGLATALWSASGYVGAFMRASNIAWETPGGAVVLQAAPAAAAGHARDGDPAGAGRARAGADRPGRAGGRRLDRRRRHGAADLGHRQVAGAARAS